MEMKLALTGVAGTAAAGPEGKNEIVVPGRRQASAARALLIAGAACAGLMTGLPALAADAESATNVDEVVVTANKMSATTVLKAPTSIQAISGETLQKQGVVGFMDIARQVPGLSVQDLGPGDRKYVIRGISSAGASTTGVYYDEAVVSGSNANDGGGFQSDIRLYDLDRIEVLRGPQGTLYGAGSMSGTIRFLTKKPNLTEFGGYVSGEFSHTEKGGDNYNATGPSTCRLSRARRPCAWSAGASTTAASSTRSASAPERRTR
jgi:outer membrane receptor protein involved in Fe transport